MSLANIEQETVSSEIAGKKYDRIPFMKILVISFVVPLVTLIALRSILIYSLENFAGSCKPDNIHGAPQLDPAHAPYVSSSDKRSLARSSGYVQFYDDSNEEIGYLKMDLREIVATSNLILLRYDCYDLQVDFMISNKDWIVLDGVTLLRTNHLETNGTEQICRSYSYQHYSTIRRFSCSDRLVLDCQKIGHDQNGEIYKKTVALMVFELLEFEIDGNQALIDKGVFSKPASGNCWMEHTKKV